MLLKNKLMHIYQHTYIFCCCCSFFPVFFSFPNVCALTCSWSDSSLRREQWPVFKGAEAWKHYQLSVHEHIRYINFVVAFRDINSPPSAWNNSFTSFFLLSFSLAWEKSESIQIKASATQIFYLHNINEYFRLTCFLHL